MLSADGLSPAGRPRGRTPWSAPPAQFKFGRFNVTRKTFVRTGLPKKGVAGSSTCLVVVDPSTAQAVCEFDRVGMPLMSELWHGIAGRLDGEAFSVRRTTGPRLRRRDRTVEVSGAVSLRLSYESRESVIRRGVDGPMLWTSRSGGQLSDDASLAEGAVACALIVNAVHQSSSPFRFLRFL